MLGRMPESKVWCKNGENLMWSEKSNLYYKYFEPLIRRSTDSGPHNQTEAESTLSWITYLTDLSMQ